MPPPEIGHDGLTIHPRVAETQGMTQQNPKHRAQRLTIDPMVIAWSLTIALSLVIVGYGIWAAS
jgi:hypothetical protein